VPGTTTFRTRLSASVMVLSDSDAAIRASFPSSMAPEITAASVIPAGSRVAANVTEVSTSVYMV
jgi:hypothetical protein